MYYFYILRSLKNQKLYLGSTPDLKLRFKSHNSGENRATKPNIPYELIYYSGFKSKKDAIECEQYFKTTAGWRRLHKMLKNSLGSDNQE
jgi:putative endonuclease